MSGGAALLVEKLRTWEERLAAKQLSKDASNCRERERGEAPSVVK
jgi:hypothetical protein